MGSSQQISDGYAADARYLLICLLIALAGGFADAGSYCLMHTFTGHVTGNALLMVISIVQNHGSRALSCCIGVTVFLAATALGAQWRPSKDDRSYRRLALPLAAEIVVIAIGVFATSFDTATSKDFFLTCLCFSLGVQNGILNKVGGISIHSTYITGMSTKLVSSPPQTRQPRWWILPATISCFLFGALLGAWLSIDAGLLGFAGVLVPFSIAFALAASAPHSSAGSKPAG